MKSFRKFLEEQRGRGASKSRSLTTTFKDMEREKRGPYKPHVEKAYSYKEAQAYFKDAYGSKAGNTVWDAGKGGKNYWVDDSVGEMMLAKEKSKPAGVKEYTAESESLEEAKGLTKAQKDGLMTIKRMGKIINNHGAIKRSVINALHSRGYVELNSRMEWELTDDGKSMADSLNEDAVNERELTPAEKEKKEEILKAMKRDGKYDPEDQESASSAHAIATAQAKKSA